MIWKGTNLLAALVLMTGPAFAEDLLATYQQALDSDPQLKAAGFKVEVGAAQKGQALGQMLPQINGTANWSENDQQIGQINQTYPGTRYYVSLTQSLMDFAKFWEWRRTQEQEKQFDAELIDARQTLMVNVVERYFSILDAQDQLYFIETEKQATETQLQQVKKQFAKQLVKITDVYEVEARLDQIEADRIEAESELLTARQALKELTNAQGGELDRLREDVEYRELEGRLEDWIEVAKSENPTLHAQRSAIEAASDDVAVQKSKHLPVVDLQLYYYDTDTGYQSVRTNHTQTQVAAINVNMPIFTGGTTMHRVDEAESKLAISKEQNEAKVRGLIKETSETFTLSNANARRIRAAEKALESAGKSHEAMKSGFKYGVKTMGDVLQAQQAEYKARRELAKSRYQYILNRVRFLKAIGTISEDNLSELNAWLAKR